jgi:hypothetical protein
MTSEERRTSYGSGPILSRASQEAEEAEEVEKCVLATPLGKARTNGRFS